jgi:hypothetical protein
MASKGIRTRNSPDFLYRELYRFALDWNPPGNPPQYAAAGIYNDDTIGRSLYVYGAGFSWSGAAALNIVSYQGMPGSVVDGYGMRPLVIGAQLAQPPGQPFGYTTDTEDYIQIETVLQADDGYVKFTDYPQYIIWPGYSLAVFGANDSPGEFWMMLWLVARQFLDQ